MTDPDRMRAVGLFDLNDSFPALLAACAEFFERHNIAEPVAFRPHHHESRGWQAEIELDWSTFCRVLDGYPLGADLSVEGQQLVARATLRAGVLIARTDATEGATITQDGVVLGSGSPQKKPPASLPAAQFQMN